MNSHQVETGDGSQPCQAAEGPIEIVGGLQQLGAGKEIGTAVARQSKIAQIKTADRLIEDDIDRIDRRKTWIGQNLGHGGGRRLGV